MTRAELIAALKEAKGADRELDSQLLSITTGSASFILGWRKTHDKG